MRFSFRRREEPRWIDTPDFAWVPDTPFDMAPSNDSAVPEPEQTPEQAPEQKPAPEPAPSPEAKKSVPASEPLSDLAVPDLGDLPNLGDLKDIDHLKGWADAEAEAAPAPVPPPQQHSAPERQAEQQKTDPAPAHTAPRAARPAFDKMLLTRLAVGAGQGLGLYLLLQARAAGLDPYLFSAAALALLLAPLVLLEGLGTIAMPLLLAWTGIVAAGLAGLGLYHHWRIQGHDPGHPGFALVILCAVMLFVTQALIHTWLNEHTRARAYRAAFEAGWTLAARAAVWLLATGLSWGLLGTGGALVNWLRPKGVDIAIDPAFLTLPLVGIISAMALHVTANRAMVMRRARGLLMALATVSLPLLVGVGTSLLVVHFTRAPVSAPVLLICAALLVVGINASHRGDGQARQRLRRWPEFAAAFVILALAAVAAAALDARVGQYGWTAPRVYACAVTIVLACYGILYGGAGLISIGGGRWMSRVEPANFVMAFVVIGFCIALVTPLADPVRLAVEAQSTRLQQGRVDPAAFDFTWLRGPGMRFGHAALEQMTHPRSGFGAEAARNAAITLSTAPDSAAPTPTEIGANITVRTPGARLPNALLAQDWSAQKDSVPPCLTVAALPCDAWFMDLDGDGRDEILLVYGNDAQWWASVLKPEDGGWRAVARLTAPPCRGSLTAMRAGDMTAADPLPGWRDLWVAGERLRLHPVDVARPDCAAPAT